MPANQYKLEHDLATMWARFDAWGAALGTPAIRRGLELVEGQIREDFRQIRQGQNPRNQVPNTPTSWTYRPESAQAVNTLVDGLREAEAYNVSALWAVQHSDVTDWASLTDERHAVAEASRENAAFWVKSTSDPAERMGGDTLERGSAGGLLDGLNFGLTGDSYSPTVWDAWGHHSREFARRARGDVEVTVFEGVPEKCVLRDEEWPELKSLIEQGVVDHLNVHVIRRNSQNGKLEEVDRLEVRSQQDFDALPQVTRTPSYQMRQQRQFVLGNITRAIHRNRDGVQTSLDDFIAFHRNAAQGNPETMFVLSHPNGSGLDLSESPANLSRVQTRASGQQASLERTASLGSLQERLEALDSEVKRRQGSDAASMYPDRRQSAASMASRPDLRRGQTYVGGSSASTHSYTPAAAQSTFPATTAFSWPSQPAPSQPAPSAYTVSPYALASSVANYGPGRAAAPTTLPPVSESGIAAVTGAPASVDLSPGQNYPYQSTDYFPPPVNAGGFSPLQPTPSRSSSTPSTRSAGSYDGAPLTRVQAHTGDSPVQTSVADLAPAAAESSNAAADTHRNRGGKKKRESTLGLLFLKDPNKKGPRKG